MTSFRSAPRAEPGSFRGRLMSAGALVALAGLSFGPVFGQEPAGLPGPPALLWAVLAPVAVAIVWGLLISRGTPSAGGLAPGGLASAVGVLAMLAVVAAVTHPGAQVASGPRRLLTSALPVEAVGPELAAVSALIGFAALIAVQLALLSRSALAPLLPTLICLFAGLGLGAGTGRLPGWYPLVFLVLVMGLLVSARLRGAGRRVAGGLLLGAGVITLFAVVAAALLGPVLPGTDQVPTDVRDLAGGPVQPRERINPFARYVALREGTVPLEITGTATPPFPKLRMVTLTEFDGRSWFVQADYRRAGHRLPPFAESAPGRTIELDVTVTHPETLGWLPSPGRAQQISVAGLGVDEQTGDVVIPDGQPTPAGYRVVGFEPTPDPRALRADEPAPSAVPLGIDLPADLLDFVGTATDGVPAGFPRFSALYSRLTEPPFVVDETAEAPGGHGLFAISALLRDKRGTSEQYASAFALMCRSLGWDARVVLGFRTRFDGAKLTVRGEDVYAWVEVRFARLGWVSVDPTPTLKVSDRPDQDTPTPTDRADDPITAAINAEQQAPPEPDSTATSSGPVPTTGAPRSSAGLLLFLLAGVALVLPVLAVPLGKVVRRTRRRRREALRSRTLGAWWEVVDRLLESGRSIRRSSTTAEVVAAAPGVSQALINLGTLADRAAYAPDDVSPDEAETAWQLSDQLRHDLRRRLPPPRRLRALFDPRPLLLRR